MVAGQDTTTAQRVEHALGVACVYLGHRDRTVAETRGRLEAKGIDEPTIDTALAALAEQGYLDDARFARRFAEDRRALDGWGAERIEQRLRKLGVARDLIAAALGAEALADELGAALALLRRRFPTPPCDARERNRALGLLLRRGYELELAHDAIRALESGGSVRS